jgi:tRNA1Val (adenine37-N6)-methyltransferase
MALQPFHFKNFSVAQAGAAHPVGTDAVLLGRWADIGGVKRFLDIGTGTGVLALLLAERFTSGLAWEGWGVELHQRSAELAALNFKNSPWSGQLHAKQGKAQDFALQNRSLIFDLIVSNPPFFSEKTVSPNHVRRLGRHSGTLPPEELLAIVRRLLAPSGRFCAVLPEKDGRRLCELAVTMGLYWTKIAEVSTRPDRLSERWLMQFERDPKPYRQERWAVEALLK